MTPVYHAVVYWSYQKSLIKNFHTYYYIKLSTFDMLPTAAPLENFPIIRKAVLKINQALSDMMQIKCQKMGLLEKHQRSDQQVE